MSSNERDGNEGLAAENERLRVENETMKGELTEIKRALGVKPGDSWASFTRLFPSARKSFVSKQKIKESQKDVSALINAAKNGEEERVEKLLLEGVPVDSRATWEFNTTPLMVASMWGHVRVVELLIANRCDLELRDEQGQTALFHAATWGRLDVVKALIDRGAKLDTPAKYTKTTPLMTAASRGQTMVCAHLVREGCNVKALDASGRNGAMLARANGFEQTAVAIEQAVQNRRKSKTIDPTNL